MLHSRRNFFIIILFFTLLCGSSVHSEDVVLTWERPNDARVSGYKVFYGLAETDFKSVPKENINSPDKTSCDIFNLTSGQTYGFAAKSTDNKGNESVLSEVIFYDVPEEQDDSPNNDNDGNGNNDKGGGGGGGCFLHLTRF